MVVLLQNTVKPKRQVPELGVGLNLDLSRLDACFGGFTPMALSDSNASREQMRAAEERARVRKEALEQAARLEASRASEPRTFEDGFGSVWEYVVLDEAEIRIVGCETESEVLRIPCEIEGLPVVALAADSCAHLGTVVEVVCPDSVVSIGYCAFRFDGNLRRAVLPRGLATYDSGWFRSCPRLEELTLPGALERLDASLFDAESLRVVRIGALTSELAPGMFGKSKLEAIEVDPENPFISSDGVAVYDKGKTAMLALAVPCESYEVAPTCVGVAKKAFCGFSNLKSVTLPPCVEVVGPFAFAHTGLSSFCAPRDLAHIGERAFFDCSSLEEADLGKSLRSLASHAFTSTALCEIEVPASIEELGNPVADRCGLTFSGPDATFRIAKGSRALRLDGQGAMYRACEDGLHLVRMMDPEARSLAVDPDTTVIDARALSKHGKLETVVLPEGLRRIEEGAFSECRALAQVTVPDSLSFVGAEAFYGTSIEAFRIPAGLADIGPRALVTCGSRHVDSAPTLRRVDVAPGNARFRREPGLVVERIGESRDRVVLCTDDVEEVHVPGTVTEIAPYAFSGVRNVRRLYLSEGVRSVGIRGLAVGCRLDLLHVDLAEPVCGEHAVEVSFPDTDRSRQQMMLALGVHDFVNVEAIMSHYDAAVVNANSFDAESSRGMSLYEQASRMLARLKKPVYLSDVNRDMCDQVLERGIESVCVEAARHDDRAMIDDLADAGYLNAGNIVTVIERVGSVQDASVTGYLLEMQRERFGVRRSFDDFEL